MEGVTRGHPCYQSSGVELGSAAPTWACHGGEEHGAKATLKALSVPPQHERVGMESKETG